MSIRSFFCKHEMQKMMAIIAFRKLQVKIVPKLIPYPISVAMFFLY